MKNAGFAISMPDGYCSDLAIRAYLEAKNGVFIPWEPTDKVRTRSLAEHLELCKEKGIPVNDKDNMSIHNDTQHCFLWIPVLVLGQQEAIAMREAEFINYDTSDDDIITEVTEAKPLQFVMDQKNRVTVVPP